MSSKEYMKAYRETHKDELRAKAAAYHATHREQALSYRLANRSKILAYQVDYRDKIRIDVLSHYGGCCQCCGEIREEFLTIDHINGDGAKHRKEIASGTAFYQWIIKSGYPEGFQVLCRNCNWAKGQHGKCPHETEWEERREFNGSGSDPDAE